jgi:hypothetical protein
MGRIVRWLDRSCDAPALRVPTDNQVCCTSVLAISSDCDGSLQHRDQVIRSKSMRPKLFDVDVVKLKLQDLDA